MSGHERSKFLALPQSIEEELTCAICLNILNNPMTTPCCRHSYCRQCILQSLQMSSNPNSCPNDRQKLLSKDLIQAPRVVTNILDKQEVYCDFKSFGCPQTVQLCQLSAHVLKCAFDPNKGRNKCQQILDDLAINVDKTKNRIKRFEWMEMKKQLDDCQRELKILASQSTSETVYVQPNTETFKNKVIESAKTNVKNCEELECNMDDTDQKQNVIKKCKEAIRQSHDYNQIGQYLVDCLNTDDDIEWSVFVYPKHSMASSAKKFINKLEVCFGDLCILLVSHQSDFDDDDDNYSDVGDDYLDYEDYGDDDGDDDDDWRANQPQWW